MRAQRERLILDFIATRKSAKVTELSTHLGVSLATVRRDLAKMEEDGLIRKVHGGAIALEQVVKPWLLPRSRQQAVYKSRIGQAAAALVQDGETIVITAGSSTEAMVPFLAPRTGLTVITNALNVAYQLSPFEHISVIVLGGWLRHSDLYVLGHMVEDALQDLRASKIFQGIYGIHPVHGLTATYLPEVQTDRLMIERVPNLIILADHTKFSRVGPVQFAPVTAASTVVTDTEAPPDAVEALRRLGITVIQA